jgi:hypothetical protein
MGVYPSCDGQGLPLAANKLQARCFKSFFRITTFKTFLGRGLLSVLTLSEHMPKRKFEPDARPTPDEIACHRQLWETYVDIYEKRGINLIDKADKLFEAQRIKLQSYGARRDFDQLCARGCSRSALASIVGLFFLRDPLSTFWKHLFCTPRQQKKLASVLNKAALCFEDVIGPITPEIGRELQKLPTIARVSPLDLIQGVRFYSEIFARTSALKANIKAHSFVELNKYLFSSYVLRATGTFHDEKVSSILAETIGPRTHNEVAQRMWRRDNYSRLNKQLLNLTRFVSSMGAVIDEQRKEFIQN